MDAAGRPKPPRSRRGNEPEPFAVPLLSKPEEANGNLRITAWIFTVIARFPTPILKTIMNCRSNNPKLINLSSWDICYLGWPFTGLVRVTF
jgi:hypothetical protein